MDKQRSVRRTAAPAASAPPLILDAHADTLDHVVRAVARSGFLPQAVKLMLASPEHLHDPELLYRTRGVRGKYGRTLLMRAVERLDVARAAEILGACPTAATRIELLACVDAQRFNSLHFACHRDRLDEEAALRVVELLLANGADPLAPSRDRKSRHVLQHAIHYAAHWSARLVQRLVQAGASIDGLVEWVSSTLIAAASAGTAQGVRMIPRLVALGARETLIETQCPAMIALARHPVVGAQPTDAEAAAALNALVSVGCWLIEEDGVGWTHMDYATHNGNAPMVRALLSLGVPATSSSLARGAKHPEVVRALLAAGAPTDELVNLDGEACYPLEKAARYSVLESVEALLAAGASVDFRDGGSFTALLHAVIGSTFDLRVIEALLAAGADVNARANEGSTALHFLAAYRAQQPWAVGAAQLLLQRGAIARAVDSDGSTPAQCVPASQRGSELHQLLLEVAAA